MLRIILMDSIQEWPAHEGPIMRVGVGNLVGMTQVTGCTVGVADHGYHTWPLASQLYGARNGLYTTTTTYICTEYESAIICCFGFVPIGAATSNPTALAPIMSWQSKAAGMFDLRHSGQVWNKPLPHHLIPNQSPLLTNAPRLGDVDIEST
ncbi:hypothetical protein BO94DRAFT_584055 [Aspergillus sclerotioniger CBS 115572]|uniref:Uncharacterized protein n=1 Tax=Aspergillus sclerotioniger CBS 115572 TaxID=1450535 RepID=A0A317X379_9EURO|nr:hypothetical protein BO94DRAFT_584055 [Aspergillus sclerotioniger CBS 115572]PWY91438.1 hypothetical protein BO94DRAFT_584055 [Aspergillus sclerotioniger CBS 115572]